MQNLFIGLTAIAESTEYTGRYGIALRSVGKKSDSRYYPLGSMINELAYNFYYKHKIRVTILIHAFTIYPF